MTGSEVVLEYCASGLNSVAWILLPGEYLSSSLWLNCNPINVQLQHLECEDLCDACQVTKMATQQCGTGSLYTRSDVNRLALAVRIQRASTDGMKSIYPVATDTAKEL